MPNGLVDESTLTDVDHEGFGAPLNRDCLLVWKRFSCVDVSSNCVSEYSNGFPVKRIGGQRKAIMREKTSSIDFVGMLRFKKPEIFRDQSSKSPDVSCNNCRYRGQFANPSRGFSLNRDRCYEHLALLRIGIDNCPGTSCHHELSCSTVFLFSTSIEFENKCFVDVTDCSTCDHITDPVRLLVWNH